MTLDTAPAKRRARWPLFAALAAVLLAGGAAAYVFLKPGDLEASGTVTLVDDRYATEGQVCAGIGGYADLKGGAQVLVTDAAGAVVGVGQLSAGKWEALNRCVFTFAVSAPGGGDIYGLQIASRKPVVYNRAALEVPLTLSIGS